MFAHDVHPAGATSSSGLAATRAVVAHCPSSNAFLGSGLFPLRRHREHGVRVALGTDVGAGTAFSLFNEGLQAYLGQMLRTNRGAPRAGRPAVARHARGRARRLGLGDEVGDLAPGQVARTSVKSCSRPPAARWRPSSPRHASLPRRALGAVFTLAREASVAEVRVAGEAVFTRTEGEPGTALRPPAGSVA